MVRRIVEIGEARECEQPGQNLLERARLFSFAQCRKAALPSRVRLFVRRAVHRATLSSMLLATISSIPVNWIPNSFAAGHGSRLVSDVITSSASCENPGCCGFLRRAKAHDA